MIILVLKEAVLGEFGEEREEKGVKESPGAGLVDEAGTGQKRAEKLKPISATQIDTIEA
jgi:hypothetical protein